VTQPLPDSTFLYTQAICINTQWHYSTGAQPGRGPADEEGISGCANEDAKAAFSQHIDSKSMGYKIPQPYPTAKQQAWGTKSTH